MYILLFILICFVIPILFTKKFEIIKTSTINENKEIENENPIISTYNYKDYETIKLLHTSTNTIEEIPLEEYLYGVVCAEMPVDFELEALKAQAVVARTYTIYKKETNNRKT